MTPNKRVLVTGASRGIGLLTVKILAKSGHSVIAGMRDIDGKNAEIAAEFIFFAQTDSLDLVPVELDVTDTQSVDTAITSIEKQGPIDVLINNAGVMPVGVTEAFTPEDILACMDVNLVGVARVCRAVLPKMRQRKSGQLIYVSSNAGRLALPFFGLYCASKWALEAYAESMHYELENFGIETTIVEPGGHATDLIVNAPTPSDQACLTSYGSVADGPAQLTGMFKSAFSEGNAINDAVNVAKKITDLIEMQSPKPLRVTVGDDMGVSKLNENICDIQAGVITALKPILGWSRSH